MYDDLHMSTEFIAQREQSRLLDLFGSLAWAYAGKPSVSAIRIHEGHVIR
jgi:hypothetical protein